MDTIELTSGELNRRDLIKKGAVAAGAAAAVVAMPQQALASHVAAAPVVQFQVPLPEIWARVAAGTGLTEDDFDRIGHNDRMTVAEYSRRRSAEFRRPSKDIILHGGGFEWPMEDDCKLIDFTLVCEPAGACPQHVEYKGGDFCLIGETLWAAIIDGQYVLYYRCYYMLNVP